MKILAPAKINLTLEVLGKRPDGYHEIRSVMQTISLCDELVFEPSESLTAKSDMPGWEPEKSLVIKAARLFRERAGSKKGAQIEVKKRIPLVSGLGGDSSDAAATLRGLSRLWKLNVSDKEMGELAAELGSDVPFFFRGGTALAEGRGEKITPLPPVTSFQFVLIVPHIPPIPGKTARLYGSLTPNDYSDGSITTKFIGLLRSGEVAEPQLYNVFERVAFEQFPELGRYRKQITRLGFGGIHLAGSGPTLFLVILDNRHAEQWCEILKRGLRDVGQVVRARARKRKAGEDHEQS